MARTATVTRPDEPGQKIKDAREAAGLTQDDLAERCLSQPYISQLERGKKRLTWGAAVQLERALDVEAGTFVDLVDSARWLQLLVTLRQRATRPLVTLRPAPAI